MATYSIAKMVEQMWQRSQNRQSLRNPYILQQLIPIIFMSVPRVDTFMLLPMPAAHGRSRQRESAQPIPTRICRATLQISFRILLMREKLGRSPLDTAGKSFG